MTKKWKRYQIPFYWAPKSLRTVMAAWNEKMLAPWKKSCDQPRQHIKKQRHYFTNKGLVKAMVFPVVMCRCESWTIKKAKCWRIDAFELWCWRILLRVPWTARTTSQSILKKINCDRVDHIKLQNSSRDGNTRPLYLSPEKSVSRSGSKS